MYHDASKLLSYSNGTSDSRPFLCFHSCDSKNIANAFPPPNFTNFAIELLKLIFGKMVPITPIPFSKENNPILQADGDRMYVGDR